MVQVASSRRRLKLVVPTKPKNTPKKVPTVKVPAGVRVPKKRSQAGAAFRGGGAALGTALGSFLGGPAGGAVGSMIGKSAGGMISKLFGHGDYAVTNADQLKQNNLVLSNSAQIPQFGSGKVAAKFVHREFLGDVYSSSTAGAFKIDSYAINPGVATTFPWLSGVVGAKFQQYRINGMAFEFRSMSADALNSTNTALGSVIMSTDYDSADVVFASKQEMENTEYGVSCKPSANMMHGIECERMQTPVSELYIRAFAPPVDKDIRLYDLGRFSIATVGCQGTNVNLGELWVTYDIDCFKAIEQAPNYLVQVSEFKLVLENVSNLSALGVVGGPPTIVVDQIGCTFERNSGTDIVKFPWNMPKNTRIEYYFGLFGASTASIPQQIVTNTNGLVALGSWVGTPYTGGTITTDFKACSCILYYDGSGTPENPPTLAFTGGVVPSSLTVGSLNFKMIGAAYVTDGM